MWINEFDHTTISQWPRCKECGSGKQSLVEVNFRCTGCGEPVYPNYEKEEDGENDIICENTKKS